MGGGGAEPESVEESIINSMWIEIDEDTKRKRDRSRSLEQRADKFLAKFEPRNQKKKRTPGFNAKGQWVNKKGFVSWKYKDYIKSPQWKLRTEIYWREHGKRCAACGNIDRPTVHHTHYGFLGRETDAHVIGLCWPCHKELHDLYGTKTVMQAETAEFIANKKMGVRKL